MVRGSQESERLLEVGQRAVDLQGLADRGRALWLPIWFPKRLRPQQSERMVRRWSRYGQGVVKGVV
eukprot:5904656-Prymnesium_polylepis.1